MKNLSFTMINPIGSNLCSSPWHHGQSPSSPLPPSLFSTASLNRPRFVHLAFQTAKHAKFPTPRRLDSSTASFGLTSLPRSPFKPCFSFALSAVDVPNVDYFRVDENVRSNAAALPSSYLTPSSSQKGIENWMMSQSTNANAEITVENPTFLISSSPTNDDNNENKPERPPTKEEIQLLQKAFATFYSSDPSVRNVPQAVELLGQCLNIWEGTKQGGDEIAGLLRVRGDAYMELRQPLDAEKDYGKAIDYLNGPDGDKADPEERPASRLGRARAIRSLGSSASPSQALQAANDYETYFNYISRADDIDDTDDDTTTPKAKTTFPTNAIIDGIQRNPYAAWEWGMVQRVAANYDRAAEIHQLASNAFEEIGDKPRAVICRLDRGLDLAAGLKDDGGSSSSGRDDIAKVRGILEEAIQSDVNVGGRDVELLQRVVAKEGEARIALSGVLWGSKDKAAAEAQFGEACGRLDELNADYQAREQERIKKGRMPPPKVQRLGFSIDDIVGADEASCSRFKNEKFIEEKLVWPAPLQSKVNKFLTLSR